MAFYVSIGHPATRFMAQEQTANDLKRVPFGVDTLEEAHSLVAMSKSTVWTIRQSESDDMWQEKGEIECSPLVKRTRELSVQEKERSKARSLATITRINAQPHEVERTFAGITVTFKRADLEGDGSAHRVAETFVGVWVGDIEIYPQSYITTAGAIQKARWIKNNSRDRWSTEPWHGHLSPLAPHLKEIIAIARQLRAGTYAEKLP